ncbi:MAG: PEP-CTERM sorting domain-containing protein [Armatimonadota bacterium]
MRRLRLLAAIAAALTVIAIPAAQAISLSDLIVSGSAGSGSSTSYLVLDFGPDSYAFVYYYDGVKTGFDMLQDLSAAVPDLQFTYWDFGGGAVFVNTFAYGPYPATGGGTTWWSYWLSDNGSDWSFAPVGAGARVLSDGSWDGWSFVPSFTDPATQPDVPLVPEPASLTVLGTLGAGWLAASRRRG